MASVSIKNLTRRQLLAPRKAFYEIADSILPEWDISLVFVGPTKARALNKQLRGKTYTPNVLSYAVGKKSGEIFICPSESAKQSSDFNLKPTTYNLFLFIHGLLHLKGWVHGAKMEKCEQKLLAKYVAANSHWNRHRHVPDKNGRGRGNHR